MMGRDVMDVSLAWRKLGFDPDLIFASISGLPRGERVQKAIGLLDGARKAARILLSKNHPDVGGNPDEFVAISEALKILEDSTADFERKMADFVRESEARASKKVMIVRT